MIAPTASPRNASPFLRTALDRPARTALDLLQRPFLHTLAPAAIGLMLIALSAALTSLLLQRPGQLDVLRPILESLAVVTPGTIVLGTWLRLRVPPRMMLAAVSLGLLTAGVVCVSLAPLFVFLSFVSGEEPRVMLVPLYTVPLVTLVSTGTVTVRVIDAADGSKTAWVLGRFFVLAAFAVFALRLLPLAVKP